MRALLFSVILVLVTALPGNSQYKNLVFEGGGIRGMAYPGALEILQKERMLADVEKVAGTSVGAITALLYSLGYTPQEMKDILSELRVQQFNDGRWFFLGGQQRFRKRYGWYRGDKFEAWLGKLIEAKTGNARCSFIKLHSLALNDKHYKDLYITATNLSKQRGTVFSFQDFPYMELKTAVRASMSIPLYYSAVFLNKDGVRVNPKDGGEYDVYVDGGVVANYPLGIFDSGGHYNPQTLGFKLERPDQMAYNKTDTIAPYNIRSFNTYVSALYNITIEGLNRDSSFAGELHRTVYISTDNIRPRVRKIRAEDKETLYQNGADAAREFITRQEILLPPHSTLIPIKKQ